MNRIILIIFAILFCGPVIARVFSKGSGKTKRNRVITGMIAVIVLLIGIQTALHRAPLPAKDHGKTPRSFPDRPPGKPSRLRPDEIQPR